MSLFYLLDQNKIPYSVTQDLWANWLTKAISNGSKTIKFTNLHKYSATISTVFLGLDHNWDISGKSKNPVLFETMIFFNSDILELNYYQERYTSYKDAIQGHRDCVRMVIKGIRDAGVIL